MRVCSIEGCNRDVHARGLCHRHYTAARRAGAFGATHARQEKRRGPRLSIKHKTVLAIPDLHLPWCHPDTFRFLEAVAAEYETDTVVQLGDLVDNHSVSFHRSDPDGLSPGMELVHARESIQRLAALFPEVIVLEGNHDLRFLRKAFEYGLPKASIVAFKELFHLPDLWQVTYDIIIDGVLYTHGTGYSGKYASGRIAAEAQRSVVHGHIHVYPGLVWLNSRYRGDIFGMNCGCLIDQAAYPFGYARDRKAGVGLGCGVVKDGIPHFIPMLLDSDGSWTGRI